MAAAAYRSATRLYDERTGLWHDYRAKGGVEFSRIYTPENAPEWAKTRESLWNGAEAKENRKNSMTAREWEIAFPHEFNVMQRREAGDAIARELMRRYGAGVDICYHKPSRDGDQRNYHAHLLYTTRGFDEDTKDGWAGKKYRDLNKDEIEVDGEKTTRSSHEVLSLREFMAGEMNRIAERDGLEVKTEHLSFEERGIDKEPTKKLGPAAAEMERRGEKSERGDTNRDIEAANDNRKKLEALREEAKIIDLEIEREKRRIAKAQAEAAKRAAQAKARSEEVAKKTAPPLHKTIDRDRERAREENSKRLGEIDNIKAYYTVDERRAAFEKANETLAAKQGFFAHIFGQTRKAEEHAEAMLRNYEDAQKKQQQAIDAINKRYQTPAPETLRSGAEIEGARLTKEYERTHAPERAEEQKIEDTRQKDKAKEADIAADDATRYAELKNKPHIEMTPEERQLFKDVWAREQLAALDAQREAAPEERERRGVGLVRQWGRQDLEQDRDGPEIER